MPKGEVPAEVHECSKCGFRRPVAIKGTQMWCPNRHSTGRSRGPSQLLMDVIWRAVDGLPLPDVISKGEVKK